MGLHVKNGTPMHGPSLCETCVLAHIESGFRESEVLVVCVARSPAHRVHFPIRECSVYRRQDAPGLTRWREIALIITPRDPKCTAGFVHVSEVREANKSKSSCRWMRIRNPR